jgi:hypothetical protein
MLRLPAAICYRAYSGLGGDVRQGFAC